MDESDLKVLGACVICAALVVVARARAGETSIESANTSPTPAVHSLVTNQVSAATTTTPTMNRTYDAFTTAGSSATYSRLP